MHIPSHSLSAAWIRPCSLNTPVVHSCNTMFFRFYETLRKQCYVDSAQLCFLHYLRFYSYVENSFIVKTFYPILQVVLQITGTEWYITWWPALPIHPWKEVRKQSTRASHGWHSTRALALLSFSRLFHMESARMDKYAQFSCRWVFFHSVVKKFCMDFFQSMRKGRNTLFTRFECKSLADLIKI